jgi:hypothetical protein
MTLTLAPPAAADIYGPDRRGEHPASHPANFAGFLRLVDLGCDIPFHCTARCHPQCKPDVDRKLTSRPT